MEARMIEILSPVRVMIGEGVWIRRRLMMADRIWMMRRSMMAAAVLMTGVRVAVTTVTSE
jgi:hypothetical protein